MPLNRESRQDLESEHREPREPIAFDFSIGRRGFDHVLGAGLPITATANSAWEKGKRDVPALGYLSTDFSD